MSTWDSTFATCALSNGNLTATSSGSNSQGTRSTSSKAAGKVYFEITLTTVATNVAIGIANSSESTTLSAGLGGDANGLGFYAVSPPQAVFINGNDLTGGTTSSTNGDIICFALDVTNSLIWISSKVMRTAGYNWNNSSSANPSTGTAGLSLAGLDAGPYFAFFNDETGGAVATINFGATSFNQTVPTGFLAWDSSASTTLSGTGTIRLSAAQSQTMTATPTLSLSTVAQMAGFNPDVALGPTVALPVLPAYGQSDYLAGFLNLLPTGRIWNKEPGSPMYEVVSALVPTIERLSVSATNLLAESFVPSTEQLLPEWQASLGLPDPCDNGTFSIGQQRNQAVARFIGLGGQSVAFFTAYAATIGYQISITEFLPFYAGISGAGQQVAGEDAAYLWEVQSPDTGAWLFQVGVDGAGEALGGFGSNVLECELQRLAPAHGQLYFAVA